MLISIKNFIIEYFNSKTMSNERGEDSWGLHNYFIHFFSLLLKHVTQYDTLWLSKNYMLYIVCTLNILNPFNPTIRSRLIKVWITKKFHAHSKRFLLEFKIAKRLPPRKSSFYIVIFVICHHFLLKVVHL
jgi:hypothetical protein